MVKDEKILIAIELSESLQEAYDISTESLWFLKERENYRLINIPFFIEGISMEDLISFKKKTDEICEIESIVKNSGNSTIWVTLNDDSKGKEILEKMHNLGCGYEGGVIDNYYTVNVPEKVSIDDIDEILIEAEENEILMCYDSSIRHQ